MRRNLKRALVVIFALLVLPCALVSLFGRFDGAFYFFAQCLALVPGIIGEYARTAFYVMTLRECSFEARVGFGSFCAHQEVTLKSGVEIGGYVILGRVTVGERTRLASMVQVLSGMKQHSRGPEGALLGTGQYTEITIGSDCWIGAGSILMADIGDRVTVGAGSVVTTPIPAGMTAFGNPARSIRSS